MVSMIPHLDLGDSDDDALQAHCGLSLESNRKNSGDDLDEFNELKEHTLSIDSDSDDPLNDRKVLFFTANDVHTMTPTVPSFKMTSKIAQRPLFRCAHREICSSIAD